MTGEELYNTKRANCEYYNITQWDDLNLSTQKMWCELADDIQKLEDELELLG